MWRFGGIIVEKGKWNYDLVSMFGVSIFRNRPIKYPLLLPCLFCSCVGQSLVSHWSLTLRLSIKSRWLFPCSVEWHLSGLLQWCLCLQQCCVLPELNFRSCCRFTLWLLLFSYFCDRKGLRHRNRVFKFAISDVREGFFRLIHEHRDSIVLERNSRVPVSIFPPLITRGLSLI